MHTATRPSADARIPARKPLYLTTPRPACIDARDEALELRRDGSAPQRFPLARIERILCNRNATWTGAALALCLSEGVPIVWLDGHGRALGSTQARQTRPFVFATVLETYLELPDWQQRFANWMTRRRLEIVTAWAMRATRAGQPPEARHFETLKREYVYLGQHPQGFVAEGEGWCHALVVGRLRREGLQSRYWGFGGIPLDLASNLAGLLWAELNLDCGTLPASTEGGLVAAHLFESWARQREGRILVHLDDLKRHLAREIEAWH